MSAKFPRGEQDLFLARSLLLVLLVTRKSTLGVVSNALWVLLLVAHSELDRWIDW